MSNSDFFYDRQMHRTVRIWLYWLALLIVIMVLVGGATRLTDSGLSITEWAPVRGLIPPLSLADWQAEFLAYQSTDEFKLVNSAMTLNEFKVIYWWEWGHRFLGRLIGLFVLIPALYFLIRGRLQGWLKPAVFGLFLLVCLQGAIGWWMVKSGLAGRVDVSQWRLAIHLTTACIFFAAVIWVARSLTSLRDSTAEQKAWQGGGLILLIFVQIFLGGLVAGLDAGMAYNSWPMMNGEWIPQGIWAIEPWWLNFSDNAMMVQFVHRVSAYILWIAALIHVFSMVQSGANSSHKARAFILLLLVTMQAAIGIMTLVLQVPFFWALLHQFGALVVLAFATAHWRAMKMRRERSYSSLAFA